MTLRKILRTLAMVSITAIWMSVAGTADRPNFLIILADDLGYSDLGCYGGEIDTPNLDRLAKNGLRFTQFYNTARCWPTRGALSPATTPSRFAATPFPAIRRRRSGHASRVGAAAAGDAEVRRLPLVSLRQMARRRQAAGGRLRPLVLARRPGPPLQPSEALRRRSSRCRAVEREGGLLLHARPSPTTRSSA